MNLFLEYFDRYVAMGLQPIAIYPKTKKPVEKQWNVRWEADRWRRYFNSANFNLGILLGDVVDVEGDTDEANELLFRLADGTPHPVYKSSKSYHHLFLTPDPKLTREVYHGIEFRGQGHHSVVPPSSHESDTAYQFLRSSRFPPPAMPAALLNFLEENRSEKGRVFRRKNPQYVKTVCRICTQTYRVHRKRLILEVKAFRKLGQLWSCHGCREFDVRASCRKIRRELNAPSFI